MEEKQEVMKVRRIFTPEQKFEILKDIERCKTMKEGLTKHQLAHSLYRKWKQQLEARAIRRLGLSLVSAPMGGSVHYFFRRAAASRLISSSRI